MAENQVTTALDTARRQSKAGDGYWKARNIQEILGYDDWRNFEQVVKKASMACEMAGAPPENHFVETTTMVEVGSGAKREERDYFLSRYACYLIAMNGSPAKPQIAIAQTYFAIQTYRQEKYDALTQVEKRIHLRDRVRDANKHLISAAKRAGVQKYGLFHDAGYRGLYGMSLRDIKHHKGLPEKDDLLDRSGRAELAANEFRITQTEQVLEKEMITGEQLACDTHKRVGRVVRNTIQQLGGTLPENLRPEPSIKKIAGRSKSAALKEGKVGDTSETIPQQQQ